jgi:hypothetical protein
MILKQSGRSDEQTNVSLSTTIRGRPPLGSPLRCPDCNSTVHRLISWELALGGLMIYTQHEPGCQS